MLIHHNFKDQRWRTIIETALRSVNPSVDDDYFWRVIVPRKDDLWGFENWQIAAVWRRMKRPRHKTAKPKIVSIRRKL